MESQQNLMRELERPPSKNNLSFLSIIQIIIMLFIGFEAASNLLSIFKIGSFSIIDLIKIVVDGLLFVGICLATYGFFTDDSGKTKNGFLLFWYGLTGLLIIIFLELFKDGFGFGLLIKILLYGLVIYVIFIQIRHF